MVLWRAISWRHHHSLVQYTLNGYDELHMPHYVHLLQATFFSDLASIIRHNNDPLSRENFSGLS